MKQARDAGFSPSMVQLLESQGTVVKESRGIFALADTPLDDFAVIALRWPKTIFSHSSALYLHGLTDIVPSVFEVSLPQGYKEAQLLDEYPNLIVHHDSRVLYSLGSIDTLSPTGTPVKAHDKERTICELLLSRKKGQVDTQLLSQALSCYFEGAEKNLQKLMHYAHELKIAPEMRMYLEVFS